LFADLLDRAGESRAAVRIVTISAAAAMAAGEGWQARAVAAMPNNDALLAAAADLCETGPGTTDRTGA
jgi:uroporphyrinogen-III synthase